MNRLSAITVAMGSALLLGVVILAPPAEAQSAKDVVGTWVIAAADTVRPDGSRSANYGPDPKGVVMFDASGRYAFILSRSGLPKFASSNRTLGTHDENKAVVQGSVAHFGRYTVNDSDKTITFHIEASTFPNWDGAEQKRPFTLSGDVLTYRVSAATGGGMAEVMLKRLN